MSYRDPHLLVRAGGRLLAIPGPRIIRIARYEDVGEARVDLSHVVGGDATLIGPDTSVVVVSAGPHASIGLLVEQATGIVTFRLEDVLAPPAVGPLIELPYFAAMAAADDELAILVDLDRLFGTWKGDT